MKIILGNPGSGKTKELLKISADKNIPILCESDARCQRLLIKAQGYGLSIPTPITLGQARETKEVIVDDIARLFSMAMDVKLTGFSVNRDKDIEVVDLDKR